MEDPPPVKCAMPDNTVEHEVWGKLMPNGRMAMDMEHPVVNVLLSHTDTPRCSTREDCVKGMQALQVAAFDRGGIGLRYNFVVGGDGNLYEGRGWLDSPPKYWKYRDLKVNKTLEIGYFGFKGEKPTDEEKKITDNLLKLGIERRYVENPTFYSDL